MLHRKKLLHSIALALKPGLIGLLPGHRSAIHEEHERAKANDRAIMTLKEQCISACDLGSDDLLSLHNLALYICLFERDQGLLKIDWLQTARTDARRRSFIARQWVTLLWDVADKVRMRAFGKPLRDTIALISPASMPAVNRINGIAAQFWRNHGGEMKAWRNIAGAHRDFDAMRQLQTIETLDLDQVIAISISFTDFTRPTLKLLTDILLGMSWREHLTLLKRARSCGGSEY